MEDIERLNYSNFDELTSVWLHSQINFLKNVSSPGLFNMDANINTMHPCDENNIEFNCSLTNYILFYLGPQRMNLNMLIPTTLLYMVIFVTGVIGNVAVCVVIVKHSSMHTATNYYLFSLAISDLMLLLFGLPNDLSLCWHQYPYRLGIGVCKLRALLSEASSYVSVLTIAAFSMERYLAVCRPLHLYTMSGLRRACRIIAAIWIVAFAAATPFAQYTKLHYLEYPPGSGILTPESGYCAMLNGSMPENIPLYELSALVFFFMPAFIIAVLYTYMGLRIRSRHGNGRRRGGALKGVNGSVHGSEARQASSRKAIIRMLTAVVVAFFICWAPFHAQRLLYIYGQKLPYYALLNEWLYTTSGFSYYISSTVNPILYNLMSNRYRKAFRETLCCGTQPKNNSSFFRDNSSFRETTVNQCEGTQLVRVRSVIADRRNRMQSFRNCRHSSPANISTNTQWKEEENKILNRTNIYDNNARKSHLLNDHMNGKSNENFLDNASKNDSKQIRFSLLTNRKFGKNTTIEKENGNEVNFIDRCYAKDTKHISNSCNDQSKISIEIYVPFPPEQNDQIKYSNDINKDQTNNRNVLIVLGSSASNSANGLYANGSINHKPLNANSDKIVKPDIADTCM